MVMFFAAGFTGEKVVVKPTDQANEFGDFVIVEIGEDVLIKAIKGLVRLGNDLHSLLGDAHLVAPQILFVAGAGDISLAGKGLEHARDTGGADFKVVGKVALRWDAIVPAQVHQYFALTAWKTCIAKLFVCDAMMQTGGAKQQIEGVMNLLRAVIFRKHN